MMTNITECPQTPEALQLDMPVEIAFEKLDEEITLPSSARPAIASGLCETVLITDGESGRSGVGRTRNVVAPTSLAGQFEQPYGPLGPPTLFTIPMLRYMKTYGLTHEQLAMVSVVQREWAAKNPRATFRTPITVCTPCRRACARCAAPPPRRSPAPRSRSATASAACSPPPARSLCRTSRREGVHQREVKLRMFLIFLALIGFCSQAFSQTTTTGTIQILRTGWNSDSFGIVTREPIQNPAHCTGPDGYVSDSSQPGYSTYYAAALTAYIANLPLVVVIDNTRCLGTRPQLIGIHLFR